MFPHLVYRHLVYRHLLYCHLLHRYHLLISINQHGPHSTYGLLRQFLKLQEKCQIVRKCLKCKGHDGRCCADEGPPIYAQQSPMVLKGGHFSTAMIGYRCKKPKQKDAVPVRPLPERKATPGGRFGNALIGYRTKNGFKPNSLPGPVNPPAYQPPGGGHISTAMIGYRTKKIKKQDGGAVRPPPESKPIPGGHFSTALIGYRTKNGFKSNSLPGPCNAPSFPLSGGGHFSTALIGFRTKKSTKGMFQQKE